MLMRNIDQAAGLCNEVRLIMDILGKNYIGATVIPGKYLGDEIIIPRLNLLPSETLDYLSSLRENNSH
jgi:hypothetical protein